MPEAIIDDSASSVDTPRPRRVLYVVSLFPSWTETFIVREIRTLIDSGIDVRILSLKAPAGGLVHAEAAALMDRVLQPRPWPAGLWNTARALFAHPRQVVRDAATIVAETWRMPVVLLKSLLSMARALEHLPWLRGFDPDFIHAHWSTCPSTAAWVLSHALDRPFGFTCHAHDIFVNRHMLPRKISESALAVTISQHNVDWLGSNVSPLAPEKMKVVHCGVDLEQIPWRPGGRDEPRILGVGRLSPEKGFATLIDALALLRDDGVAFHCDLVGEGPFRDELQARVDRHRLGARVSMGGALPQEAVRAALDRASVFVLPCEIAADGSRDGIPVALMEAMAAGCPVVSCPVSGVPELISDGVHGLLAAERDAAGLAHALKRLLEDEGLRQRVASAARERIELEFDARKEALRLHGLMTEALGHAA
ncbi:glycosyltransferase family 4 protein [Luteimonas arsenica]|uniref:glycosyltransferase family 4 protein n=1 Tax=Luteimonas arsenica TaxID=1586242 RepID=UPI001054DB0E|nr:glycosyltransferase family 4 protein [Luteimonas arsenica]